MIATLTRDNWVEIMKYLSTYNMRCLVQTNKEMSKSIINEEIKKRKEETDLFYIYRSLCAKKQRQLYKMLGKFGVNWNEGIVLYQMCISVYPMNQDTYIKEATWDFHVEKYHKDKKDILDGCVDVEKNYNCVCGKNVKYKSRSTHKKSKAHINLVKQEVKKKYWEVLNVQNINLDIEPKSKNKYGSIVDYTDLAKEYNEFRFARLGINK